MIFIEILGSASNSLRCHRNADASETADIPNFGDSARSHDDPATQSFFGQEKQSTRTRSPLEIGKLPTNNTVCKTTNRFSETTLGKTHFPLTMIRSSACVSASDISVRCVSLWWEKRMKNCCGSNPWVWCSPQERAELDLLFSYRAVFSLCHAPFELWFTLVACPQIAS